MSVVIEGYRERQDAVAALRSARTTADALNTPLTMPDGLPTGVSTPRPCLGNHTLYVHGRHANASATVVVRVNLYRYDPASAAWSLIGLAAPGEQTLTASGDLRDAASGAYLSPPVAFDLAGANGYMVFMRATSGGAVDLHAEAVGPNTRPGSAP
jgi:hypothetical protein